MNTTHADPTTGIEPAPAERGAGKIVCNACPVLCNISEGRLGACDRYANRQGVLTRLDPLVLTARAVDAQGELVAFDGKPWDGNPLDNPPVAPAVPVFVTGIGSTTTYPDYKPAPFIVAARHAGVDTVTVVTEGVFSYCSFKVKIDTDRYIGPEQANVRCDGEVVGHVTTAEYGSQMLSLGGVHHLTGGSKREGRVTCQVMMDLGNKQPVELDIEGGAKVVVAAGRAPVINGVVEQRMRVGCGSATIGIFAPQWKGHVDEVIVVDDHITGVLTEHQAGKYIDMAPSGIRIRGKRSTPGRYFQVANPGMGWGGTDITDPLSIIERVDAAVARPGQRVLFVSTTGEDHAYFVLDDRLAFVPAPMPAALVKVVERIGENCEPALCSVLFLGGAGGSLRAGVTENPIALTRSIKDLLTNVTAGGAPAYVWPGGGIMMMVDVARMPDNAFGSVPTPAIVAPIEFTMRLDDYAAMGGYMHRVRSVEDVLANERFRLLAQDPRNPWPIGEKPVVG
ncbi:MAG: 6-hydroxynicotinate reductase [Burkholderiales bacterium]|nr:6-hydroxynicotinate reductase [Burkholderiales bacterium]